jgi:hypothetical protein
VYTQNAHRRAQQALRFTPLTPRQGRPVEQGRRWVGCLVPINPRLCEQSIDVGLFQAVRSVLIAVHGGASLSILTSTDADIDANWQ